MDHRAIVVVKTHVHTEIFPINTVKSVFIPLRPLSAADIQSLRPSKDNSVLSPSENSLNSPYVRNDTV